MRIISKFNDYYDSARGYGFDPKLIYKRETKLLTLEGKVTEAALIEIKDKANNFPKYSAPAYTGAVFFCGKYYPYIAIHFKYKWEYYYSFNSFYNKMKSISTESSWEFHTSDFGPDTAKNILKELNSQVKKNKYYFGWGKKLTSESLKGFLSDSGSKITDDSFRYLNSPAFVIRSARELIYTEYDIEVNPILKDYNFASAVDPFAAFQELSMYVGNNLVDQMDPEVKISDKTRAESKGFDKWSFRRHKSESKKNR